LTQSKGQIIIMEGLKDEDKIWSLGYGSNMDVESVEGKKNIKIFG